MIFMVDENKNSLELLNNPNFHKHIALENCTYFSKYYLNYVTPRHQQNWYKILEKSTRELLLAPRDHGKSATVTCAYPIWRISRNRNIRILIISKTGHQSWKFVNQIAQILEKNEKLKKDFGDFKGKETWSGNQLFVSGRTMKEKDPTIEGVGVLGAITGGHFDIIIADDILDDENTKTFQRMQSVADWFKGTILQLAEPSTQIIVVGTRKHYSDIYNDLLNNKLWHHTVDKAIIKWPDKYEYVEDENGVITDVKVEGEYEVLWPEKWTIKALLLDRYQTGEMLFNREKQNDPSGMRGQMLKREWLNYYTKKDGVFDLPHLPTNFKRIYIGVDLAISENPSADYFVACVVGECENGKWWVIEFVRGHFDFPAQVLILQQLTAIYRPRGLVKMFIERNAYQYAMTQYLAKNTAVPAVPVQTTKDKVTRITGITPFFQNKKIFINEMDEEFIKEWIQFPKSEHDDMLDSLDFALTELRDVTKSPMTFGSVHEFGNPNDVYNPETKQLNVNKLLKTFKRQGNFF